MIDTPLSTCIATLPDGVYMCRFCSLVRPALASMKAHIARQHIREVISCYYCGEEFESVTCTEFIEHSTTCIMYKDFLEEKRAVGR